MKSTRIHRTLHGLRSMIGSRNGSADRRRLRWLGRGLLTLGAGLAATSILGPLVTGAIKYRVPSLMVSQLKGADAVSLLVVAPGCIALGTAALRGHRLAAPLALGPAAYTMYMVAEVVVGPDYLAIPGNVERFFALFLGLFLVAGAVGAGAWSLTDPVEMPALSAGRARVVGATLVGSATLLVVGRYVPALSDAMSAHPASAAYVASPTIFWTIALEDLGVVIPAMFVTGIGTWRRRRWAVRARAAVVGWSALVPVAVVAMAITMYTDGAPGASAGDIAVLSVLAVILMMPVWLCYAPSASQGARAGREPRPQAG